MCGGDGKLRLGVAGGELVQSVVGEQQTQHGGAELGEVQPEETGRGVTMDLCRCTLECIFRCVHVCACVHECMRARETKTRVRVGVTLSP